MYVRALGREMEKDWVPELSSAAERFSTRPEEEKLACKMHWKVNGTFVGGSKEGYTGLLTLALLQEGQEKEVCEQ